MNDMSIKIHDRLLASAISCQSDITTNKFWSNHDVHWMNYAIKLAKDGAECGEVPVGAVLVHEQAIIGQGFNEPIRRCDATAHAEIVALREACQRLNNYRLPQLTTLYVTLEPCTMCIGALIHARVNRLVNLPIQPFYNHHIQVQQGLCAEHSSRILKEFFRKRRQIAKKHKNE